MEFTMYAGFAEMVGEKGIEETAKYVASMGFSSVEILADAVTGAPLTIPDVEAAKEARKVLEKYGLKVACYSVYANACIEKSLIEILGMVEIAAALGSPYFHHTLLPWINYSDDLPHFDEAIAAAVDAAQRIADHAKQFGITCLYEDQGYFVNGVKGFGKFFRELQSRCENVGVCGDVGNILFVNEKAEDFFAEFAKDIKHVHVKDYLWKEADQAPGVYWLRAAGKSWLRDTMIGDGVVNFEACMKILKEVGYNGPFSLETGHPEPYEVGVKQAMEYLQRYW